MGLTGPGQDEKAELAIKARDMNSVPLVRSLNPRFWQNAKTSVWTDLCQDSRIAMLVREGKACGGILARGCSQQCSTAPPC